MRRLSGAIPTAAMVLIVGIAARLAACPVCQLGASALTGAYAPGARACRLNDRPATQPSSTQPADGLAGDGTAMPERDRGKLPLGLTATGGIDFTTAYYHRGYVMDDRGLIAQPYLNLSLPLEVHDRITVTPYVGGWADIQRGGTHNSGLRNGTASSGGALAPMPCCADDLVSTKARASVSATGGGRGRPLGSGYDVYETDVTGGVAIDDGPLFIDLRYRIYTFPGGALSDYQEIGAKVSYDLASLWLPPAERANDFLLRPFVEFDHQIEGAARRRYNYVETGIEPSFTVPLGGTRVGISLPIDIGLSASDYYSDRSGSNQALGYYSAGLKASVPLPMPARFGAWYLTGTVTYLRLNADNLKILNHGAADQVIGTLGISFAY